MGRSSLAITAFRARTTVAAASIYSPVRIVHFGAPLAVGSANDQLNIR